MARSWVLLGAIFAVVFGGVSLVSAAPGKIVAGVVSKAVSALVIWIFSINSTSRTAVSTRSMVQFEAGYVVETVFDGSKLGIEPYSVRVSPSGEEFLILDAENSNIHKISIPFSQFCRSKLFAGSSEGYSGHVDGKLRDARMSHPRGLTMDERGNIYIADTKNKAIRKISDAGVTTIAGGKWRRSGHVDGPSEDAKFSNDFDVVYVGSSCSLLVVDRGNQAIREIQLRADDCTKEDDGSFLLGMAMITAAGLSGYVMACLQYRLLAMFSSKKDSRARLRKIPPLPPYQRSEKSVGPFFIPSEEEEDDQAGENIICSLGKLFLNTGSSAAEIFVALFLGARRTQSRRHIQQHYQVNKHQRQSAAHDDEPPHFPYTAARLENVRRYRRSWAENGGWDGGGSPEMWQNESFERSEVVFGEVQEEEQVHEQKEEESCRGEGRSFSSHKDYNLFMTEGRMRED